MGLRQGRLPEEVPVLQPTWLPARFREAPFPERAGVFGGEIGPSYLVGYRSDAGDVLLFALGTVNAAEPDTADRIGVRGTVGSITTSASWWPPIAVYWLEGSRRYAVQACGVSRDEMLRIAAGLAPVGVEVLEAGPRRLPSTGMASPPIWLVGVLGILLTATGLAIRSRSTGLCRGGSW